MPALWALGRVLLLARSPLAVLSTGPSPVRLRCRLRGALLLPPPVPGVRHGFSRFVGQLYIDHFAAGSNAEGPPYASPLGARGAAAALQVGRHVAILVRSTSTLTIDRPPEACLFRCTTPLGTVVALVVTTAASAAVGP